MSSTQLCVILSTLLYVLRILAAGRETAEAFKNLLELLHQVVMKPTPDNKAKLPTLSKEVAKCVGEIVHAAESIRGKYWALHGWPMGLLMRVNGNWVCMVKGQCSHMSLINDVIV